MSPPDPLVDLRGVAARVGVATILRDVDFALDPGDSIGLYGANGSGKTTLLRVIATLLPPTGGTGRVLGAGLTDSDRFDVRSRIGLIGHVPALYPELSLAENLRFAARVSGVADTRVGEVLATVGLGGAADRRAAVCSHGMQRRAEFARVIMLEPDLLLLDEPHTALDPAAVELVGHVVGQVTGRGGGVVVVSHDRARVEPMVTHSLSLAGGTLP